MNPKKWKRAEAQGLQRQHWMMEDLIEIRRRRKMSQDDVDRAAGWMPGTCAGLEDYQREDWDPHMRTIRMYALVVGALIQHTVYQPITREQDIT